MSNLPQSVNARVRAAAARNGRFFAEQSGKRIFDDLLDAQTVFLSLPPAIIRAEI